MEKKYLYNNGRRISPIILNDSIQEPDEDIIDVSQMPTVAESADADLDFADENGYVLMRLKDGHVKTSRFDSAAVSNHPSSYFAEDAFATDVPFIEAIKASAFGSNVYLRIPFCEFTNSGVLIVGCDVRYGNAGADKTHISLAIARSYDGGKTFTEPQIIIPHTDLGEYDRRRDGTILVDRTTGRIFVICQKITSSTEWTDVHELIDFGQDTVFVYSDNDGETWSEPESIIPYLTDASRLEKDIITFFGGVGNGVTMQDGTIFFPIQCGMTSTNTSDGGDANGLNATMDGIMYSHDHGQTWTISNLIPCQSSEVNVIEYAPGKLLSNSRGGVGKRRMFASDDLGSTWKPWSADKTIIEPTACQGSFIVARIGYKAKGLFSNPQSSARREMISVLETTDYINYHPTCLIHRALTSGYTCLASHGDKVVCIYETERKEAIRICDISHYVWA